MNHTPWRTQEYVKLLWRLLRLQVSSEEQYQFEQEEPRGCGSWKILALQGTTLTVPAGTAHIGVVIGLAAPHGPR